MLAGADLACHMNWICMLFFAVTAMMCVSFAYPKLIYSSKYQRKEVGLSIVIQHHYRNT